MNAYNSALDSIDEKMNYSMSKVTEELEIHRKRYTRTLRKLIPLKSLEQFDSTFCSRSTKSSET